MDDAESEVLDRFCNFSALGRHIFYHRLWFWLAVYLLTAFFINGLGLTNLAAAAALLSFLPGLFIYLEGPNLIAARNEFHGWTLAGVLEADSEDTARHRWLSGHLETGSVQTPLADKARARRPQRLSDEDAAFGLFASD